MPNSARFSLARPVIDWRGVRAWWPCTLGTACVLVAVPLALDIAISRTLCWPEPGVAVITAVVVVGWAHSMAPRAKAWVAATWWGVGAWLSARVFSLSTYPECHARAYESANWPWPLAVATGGVVWALLVWRSSRFNNRLATVANRNSRP